MKKYKIRLIATLIICMFVLQPAQAWDDDDYWNSWDDDGWDSDWDNFWDDYWANEDDDPCLGNPNCIEGLVVTNDYDWGLNEDWWRQPESPDTTDDNSDDDPSDDPNDDSPSKDKDNFGDDCGGGQCEICGGVSGSSTRSTTLLRSSCTICSCSISLIDAWNKLQSNWDSLTPKEQQFVKNNPLAAYSFWLNAQKAEAVSSQLYSGQGSVDTQRDAFRHTYWSAMNAFDWGRANAEAYGNAHEDKPENFKPDGTPTDATAMDYYNNSIGYWIGEQTRLEGGTESDVYNRVVEVANSGALHYLK